MAPVSVVIVSYESRLALGESLPPLVAQLRDGDELIVVDNASSDGSADEGRRLAPEARVIETGSNLGFAAACNRGAEAATGELLVLLNPDAVVQPGWRDGIERPLTERRGWAAWQALVTADGGSRVNTRGGVLHFTGIAWAGDAGKLLSELPAGEPIGLADPGFVSGACLAIPRASYLAAGEMPDAFFLYHEDVDLSLRLRLAGGALGVEPAARVDHDYEFSKGPQKWRYLERNRWATLIRTYPGPLLVLLAPALLATELALIAVSLSGGWFRQKLLAWGDTWRRLPALLGERRVIRSSRKVGSGEFARPMTAALDSAFLGRVADSRLLAAGLRLYWSLVTRLVGADR